MLVLKFLGTGSLAEVPERGCDCPQCKEARKGGKSKRKYSTLALFHKRWKFFDVNEQTLPEALELTLDPVALFYTHRHPDHFLEQSIAKSWFPDALYCMKSGHVWSDASVRPIRVTHSIKAPAVGYIFEGGGWKIAYLPDCLDLNEEHLKGVDIAIVDGSSLKRDIRRQQDKGKFGHRSMYNWCRIAKTLGIGQLIFTHIGHVYRDHDSLEKQVRVWFENSQVAYDGLTIELAEKILRPEQVNLQYLRQLTDSELLDLHRKVHIWYAEIQAGGKLNLENVVNAHRFVVQEMARRNLEHRLMDPLDRILKSGEWALYLVEPHGQLIAEGRKRLIVRSVQYTAHIGEPIVIVSGDKKFAKVRLYPPFEIKTKEEFDSLRGLHCITDEEYRDWNWEGKKLYGYKFELLEVFRPPEPVSVPRGVQGFFRLAKRLTDEEWKVIEGMGSCIWVENFVSLTGSATRPFEEPRDIDLVVRAKYLPETHEFVIPAQGLILKLMRMFPPEMQERVSLIPEMTGPNWPYIALFHLKLEKIEPLVWKPIPEPEFRFYKSKEVKKLKLEQFRAEGIDEDISDPKRRWRQLIADLRYLANSGLPRLEAGKKWGDWTLDDLKRYFAAVVDALRSVYFPLKPPPKGSDAWKTSYWRLYSMAERYMKTKPPQTDEELREWDRKRKALIQKQKKLKLMEPFVPLKAATGYRVGEFFDKEDLWKFAIEPLLKKGKTIIAEPKYDGLRFVIHRDGDRVAIYTEDAHLDRAPYLPTVVKLVKGLKPKQLILDAEFVQFDEENENPIPRADMGALRAKRPYTGPLRVYVHDCIWLDEDIHLKPYSARLKALRSVIPKTIWCEKKLQALVPTVYYEITDRKSFDKAIAACTAFKGSEGAMLKSADSEYDLTGKEPRHSEWFKYKLVKEIRVQVIGKYKKPAPWEAIGKEAPKEELTGDEAWRWFQKLRQKSRTYIYRVAFRWGDKLVPIETDHRLTPRDLEIRWNPKLKRPAWQGVHDERAWEMDRRFKHRGRGEIAYGATYATNIDVAIGQCLTVSPIRMDVFYDEKQQPHFSWTFPIVRNPEPKGRKPDTIEDVKRILEASGVKFKG